MPGSVGCRLQTAAARPRLAGFLFIGRSWVIKRVEQKEKKGQMKQGRKSDGILELGQGEAAKHLVRDVSVWR